MSTIDDIIMKIGEATRSGDWRQVQSHAVALNRLVHDQGRSINASSAADLVQALAQ